MLNPKVTVIIPTYNRAPFLREAIDSVLAQDFRDFELLVVDDGSTDETGKLLVSYGDAIQVLRTARVGVSGARNTGIRASRSKYIAFLDSDDLWLKKKLSLQVSFMDENPRAKICYTDEIWIRKGARVNPKKYHAKFSGWIFERCIPLCIISPSSVLLRREIFDEVGLFDETMPVCEDYDMWLRIAVRYPVFLIERKLIIKRGGHEDQLSTIFWGKDRYRVKALIKILSDPYLTEKERESVLKAIMEKCRILASGFAKRGKEKERIYYEEIAGMCMKGSIIEDRVDIP